MLLCTSSANNNGLSVIECEDRDIDTSESAEIASKNLDLWDENLLAVHFSR